MNRPWMRTQQARSQKAVARQLILDTVAFVWCLVLIVAAMSVDFA